MHVLACFYKAFFGSVEYLYVTFIGFLTLLVSVCMLDQSSVLGLIIIMIGDI